MKNIPKLNNWIVCIDNRNIDVHFHLSGEVQSDNKSSSEHRIYTSRVVSIFHNIATTKTGTKYKLGFPRIDLRGIVKE